MQPVISIEKVTLKKPKSSIYYPKKLSSYIIAFAMNDNTKAPGIEITHKSSHRNGIAITSSVSTKTMKCSKENIDDTQIANDSTTRIKEYCGDIEEKCTNDTSQPQVIFIAQKHTRKPKFESGTNYKKLKKCKPVVIIKNIRFKNQRARNITSKLKRYCNQSKKTYDGSHNVNKELDNESIKRVSRTRILKKVLAKENFLAEDNHTPRDTNFSFDGDLSFISISSQGTLKQEDSPHSANSIIEVLDRNMTSFDKNIINVAVVQISNTPNLNRNSNSIIVPHKENPDFKDSLTSYESAFSQTLMLTSNSFINNAIKLTSKNTLSDASYSNSNISNETLIPPKARSEISHNTFEIDNSLVSRKTNNNIYSCATPKCSFSYQIQDNNTSFNNCQSSNNNELIDEDLTRTLYDSCMTFNIYQKTRACSSSVPDFPNNDNVIIAEDMLKTTQQIQNIKNRGDKRFGTVKDDFHANIFQKPFNVDNADDYQKNFNLPNAAQIKSNITNTSRQPRKCFQEVNDYPGGFPELCDKLTIILEIAVKKLEQTLSEKIVKELKRSLYEIDNHIKSITKFQEKITSEYMTEEIKLENTTKSKITLKTMPHTDANLQCDIVQNEVIDKLMLTFNEESNSCVQSSSSNYTHKLKKPKLVKNYFDILKNSLSFHYKEPEIGKGESVQISIEDAVEEKEPQFGWKKTFITIPIRILRENMLVVASVPAFLFVMFVVYSYIMLLIRMWWY